jgi:hypothetical protein
MAGAPRSPHFTEAVGDHLKRESKHGLEDVRLQGKQDKLVRRWQQHHDEGAAFRRVSHLVQGCVHALNGV